jgi:hypothetical protein
MDPDVASAMRCPVCGHAASEDSMVAWWGEPVVDIVLVCNDKPCVERLAQAHVRHSFCDGDVRNFVGPPRVSDYDWAGLIPRVSGILRDYEWTPSALRKLSFLVIGLYLRAPSWRSK